MKRGPFGDIKKFAKKVSQSRNNLHKNIFGPGREWNPRPSAWQTSKNPQVPAEVVWQLVLVQANL